MALALPHENLILSNLPIGKSTDLCQAAKEVKVLRASLLEGCLEGRHDMSPTYADEIWDKYMI